MSVHRLGLYFGEVVLRSLVSFLSTSGMCTVVWVHAHSCTPPLGECTGLQHTHSVFTLLRWYTVGVVFLGGQYPGMVTTPSVSVLSWVSYSFSITTLIRVLHLVFIHRYVCGSFIQPTDQCTAPDVVIHM